MANIKKLGDIKDMERYLAYGCYCPGEIYDITGFFYQIFSVDDECVLIEQSDAMTAVVTSKDVVRPQAIIFWHDDDEKPGQIIDAQRVDATENNIGILRDIVKGKKPDGRKLDEFELGSKSKSLKQIAEICDLVMVDQERLCALLPQLDRGSDYESERRRFKSYRAHQNFY